MPDGARFPGGAVIRVSAPSGTTPGHAGAVPPSEPVTCGGHRPRFSIGVTTVRRRDGLLAETLRSILLQDFDDLEVVVGNNNPALPLAPAHLGIDDPRVRVVNHPVDLGLLGNWRALLQRFTGQYVTWIADDDAYQPDFLRAADAALTAVGDPAACYTGYAVHSGVDAIPPIRAIAGTVEAVSGMQLLWDYLTDGRPLVATMGLFSRSFATDGLPWRVLAAGNPAGEVFGEYAFVVAAANLACVAYVPDPLVCLRDHPGSWGGQLADPVACERSARWLGQAALSLLPAGIGRESVEVLLSLLGVVALRQTVNRSRNGGFTVNADAIIGAVRGGLATRPTATDASAGSSCGSMGWPGVLLHQSRLYAAAEVGRIAKESVIRDLAAAAAARLELIERLTDDLAACRVEVATQSAAAEQRLQLVTELAAELASCRGEAEIQATAAEERLRLVENLTRELDACRVGAAIQAATQAEQRQLIENLQAEISLCRATRAGGK